VVYLNKRQQIDVLIQKKLFARKYETELLTDKPEVIKPMINRILRNFEEIKYAIDDMEKNGDTLKEPIMGLGRSTGSSVEKNIITLLECSKIKNLIDSFILSLDHEKYEIILHHYWHGLPQNQVARVVEISERTIRRRFDEIHEDLIDMLEKNEVTFYNLYWFDQKFMKKFKEVS
jgi:hypothetical protein